MDTWLSHCHPRFVLGGGVIAEGRVTARPVIEHLDVLEDILPCGVTSRVVPMVHELTLECPGGNKRGRESLLERVVPCKNPLCGTVNSMRPTRMLRYLPTCDATQFRCNDPRVTRNTDSRPRFFLEHFFLSNPSGLS